MEWILLTVIYGLVLVVLGYIVWHGIKNKRFLKIIENRNKSVGRLWKELEAEEAKVKDLEQQIEDWQSLHIETTNELERFKTMKVAIDQGNIAMFHDNKNIDTKRSKEDIFLDEGKKYRSD